MPDAQKIAPCDKCGGAGGLDSLDIPWDCAGQRTRLETRYRVKCTRCGHMTPHFCDARLAVTLWNSWAEGGAKTDLLAG